MSADRYSFIFICDKHQRIGDQHCEGKMKFFGRLYQGTEQADFFYQQIYNQVKMCAEKAEQANEASEKYLLNKALSPQQQQQRGLSA